MLAPPPPEPTRTPRPGEEPLPPDLPFEPQRCSAGPCLSVTSASGLPGDVVSIDVWIDDDGIDITATENELAFPLLAQIESCAVNPDIDKNGSAFRIDADYFKAIVIALDNVVPIPGGSTLYTCQVGSPPMHRRETTSSAAPSPAPQARQAKKCRSAAPTAS